MSTKKIDPEQTNDPAAYHDPGAVTPEALAAHDAAQQEARTLASQATKDVEKKEAEGGPADTGADKGDGSQEPAFETNTPSKAPKSDFRALLEETITKEVTVGSALLGAGRGTGNKDQQEILFKWVELGVKLSNDDEI
jgi:hypothetical protein